MVEFHKVLELGPRKTAFSLSLFGITQYPGGPCLCALILTCFSLGTPFSARVSGSMPPDGDLDT